MSLTVAEQRDVYPLANYAFRVVVDGVALRFTKVSGLSREYKLVTYRHGLSFQEGEQVTKVPAEGYTSLTLEQGTVLGSAALPAWLEQRTSSPLEVSLCDEKGVPVLFGRSPRRSPSSWPPLHSTRAATTCASTRSR